jgi:PadR family transcriptional regulator PadR
MRADYLSSSEIREIFNNSRAQMRKGILDFCVLLVVSRGEVYASDILKILKDADLLIVEGTLYPLLNRLRRLELLGYRWEESKSGPPRKYYYLTQKGEETLKNLSAAWQNMSKSINSLIE